MGLAPSKVCWRVCVALELMVAMTPISSMALAQLGRVAY